MHRIIGHVVATWLLSGVATVASGSPMLLDRHPERVVSMEIAEESRSEVARAAPVKGPWRIVHSVDGVRTWEAPIPVRPRTLFFHRPPSGMKLDREKTDGSSKRLKHVDGLAGAGKADTWAFSADAIQVRRSLSSGPPAAGEYSVRYDRARVREEGLNKRMSDVSVADFVFRSVQVGDTNRHGLHLPAPSEIRFLVDVPAGGVLKFESGILPPEAAMEGADSDGAALIIEIHRGNSATILQTIEVGSQFEKHRVDLSQYGGETVTLGLKSSPGNTTTLDYVFIAAPTIYTPKQDSPQVVLIFIDTLRADAMGMYGYDRDTSPKLDEWAEQAAVFTQARSVAPWTLPSARTMVTGTHPERWDKTDRLQDRLAKNGWATGMVAGNVYLSSNFEMADGWGTHRCVNWPQGSMQIRRGEAFLEDHKDQPAFLLLHLMDMHLPYTEPLGYRSLFVDEVPSGVDPTGYFLRNEVNRMVRSGGEVAKAYVRGRYDNNMRYLDDQLEGFLDGLRDDAVVLITSDHGEEFWEHGGFEHGHTLYDELLRVPMILRGPGVTSGRFDTPTSLLDVAPTLAAMMGVDTVGMAGEDLRGLADGSAAPRFEERPLSFGRPLYGLRRWGSLHEGMKYSSFEGDEEVYNLDADPGEQSNLIETHDPAPLRNALSTSLERPYVPVWRLVLNKSSSSDSVRVRLKHPMAGAWVGDDPTMRGKARVDLQPDHLVARWPKQRGMVEVFVLPNPDDLPETLDVEVKVGKRIQTHTITLVERERPEPGQADTLLEVRLGGRTLTMTSAFAPVPSELDSAIEGFDAEVAGDLESLGYIDKGEENP